MKWNGIYFIFIVLEIVQPISMPRARAQVTFLDDPIFRPVFRRMRNFFFNLNNFQTDDEIMRLSLRMNVSFNLIIHLKISLKKLILEETSKTIL